MPLEELAWNLMFIATDPDKCWELASQFRKTSLPGNVTTCETSFLMGSVVRDIIRSTVREELQENALRSAAAAYSKSFDDASKEDLPPEMLAIYKNLSLKEISAIVLSNYDKELDFLPATLPIFVHRIHGDPRMKFEIQPLIEQRKETLQKSFKELLGSNAQ